MKPKKQIALTYEWIGQYFGVAESTVEQWVQRGHFDPNNVESVVQFVVGKKLQELSKK